MDPETWRAKLLCPDHLSSLGDKCLDLVFTSPSRVLGCRALSVLVPKGTLPSRAQPCRNQVWKSHPPNPLPHQLRKYQLLRPLPLQLLYLREYLCSLPLWSLKRTFLLRNINHSSSAKTHSSPLMKTSRSFRTFKINKWSWNSNKINGTIWKNWT